LVGGGDGREQLIGGAAGIRRIVGQAFAEILGQFTAEPIAEYHDHDVAFGGFGNLLLEIQVGRVERPFPADTIKPRRRLERGIQPRHYDVEPLAFLHHVARRGDEQLDDTQLRHG